jgi:predicted nucleic-acid-binding Zn-ribbon protein
MWPFTNKKRLSDAEIDARLAEFRERKRKESLEVTNALVPLEEIKTCEKCGHDEFSMAYSAPKLSVEWNERLQEPVPLAQIRPEYLWVKCEQCGFGQAAKPISVKDEAENAEASS